MKNIWDNFSEQIKTWAGTATEKAGVISRAAAAKAEELSKVGKLKMDIYQLRREQARLYADLGQIAYRTMEGQNQGTIESQSGVEDLRHRISDIASKIKEKEDEVERASHMEEPIYKATPSKEKPVPKKEVPASEPEEKKTTAKKKAPARKPATAKKGSSGKKTAATPRKTAPRKTTKGTETPK